MLQKWGHTTKQVSFYLFLLFFLFWDCTCKHSICIRKEDLGHSLDFGTLNSFLVCLRRNRVYVAQPKWPINQFRLVFPKRRDSATFWGQRDRSSFIVPGQRDNGTISKSCQGPGRAGTACQNPGRVQNMDLKKAGCKKQRHCYSKRKEASHKLTQE